MSHLLLSLLLLSFISCGRSHHKKNNASVIVPAVVPAETILTFEEASYKMSFTNLNPSYFSMKGEGSIVVDATDMIFKITMSRAPMLRSIYQNLYSGDCPTINDDKNGDGIIDINEAKAHLTRILIPLDSDVNSSASSRNVFPHGSITGKYNYQSKGKAAAIAEDLKERGETENIDLEKTVVLLQGLPVYYRFPNSVESSDGLPVTETLPVSCGTISRL